MILGLLPELAGGLGELARTGQHTRFVDGYLGPYARAFDEVRYFSYLRESLDEYTDDADLRARVHVFPGGGWHPWLYGFAMPLRYGRALAGCGVLRVFHVTGVLPALIARRRSGVPFVTTYGFWYERLARTRGRAWLRRGISALGLAAADAVIVTTPALAAHVATHVRDARKVHLIPNGVDTAKFLPAAGARPAATRARRRRLLFVGRLAPEKSLETLVAAARKLSGRFELELVFAGDGPLRARLAAAAADAGVPLALSGVVDHRALPPLYASADAFVLPSLTEGHPKALIEALSAGVPCVASDLPATRSVLADGAAGLLVEPGDADALAAALERVLGDDAFAHELGERGRARAVEQYDLGGLVAREIDLLVDVARRRPGAR